MKFLNSISRFFAQFFFLTAKNFPQFFAIPVLILFTWIK